MVKIWKNLRSSMFLLSLNNFWNEFKKYKPGYICTIVILLAILLDLLAPYISPYDPSAMSFKLLDTPSLNHPMGTDYLGRDIVSRVLYGLRTSLLIGIGAASISTILGVFLGAIPGYYGGKIDYIFSRFFEIFMNIPSFFLVILSAAFFGSNIYIVMFIIGLTSWPSTARMMRSQVMTIKKREFIESSIVIGGGDIYTLFKHIVPNGLYPVITMGMLMIGSAMLTEAGLSFLGLGDPNALSLGKEIRTGTRFLRIAPHMVTFPGLILIIIVFAFNLVGDGLNLVFNPRLRER